MHPSPSARTRPSFLFTSLHHTDSLLLIHTHISLCLAFQSPLFFQRFEFFDIGNVSPRPEWYIDSYGDEEREGVKSVEEGFCRS